MEYDYDELQRLALIHGLDASKPGPRILQDLRELDAIEE